MAGVPFTQRGCRTRWGVGWLHWADGAAQARIASGARSSNRHRSAHADEPTLKHAQHQHRATCRDSSQNNNCDMERWVSWWVVKAEKEKAL
jgi:hypothetical protein